MISPPDIFLSYKREDEAKAARLAKALEGAGFTVWWDRSLLPAASWRAQIQTALDAAKVTVVIWTRESTGPAGDFVRDEASQAKARGVLVPVMMEKTRLPLGFGELQAVDLVGWRGSPKNVFFKDLVAAIQAKIEGGPAPKPKGPITRLRRRAFASVPPVVLIGGLAAFGANILSIQETACSAAFVQPGLSDTCGAWGLGDKPTREERLAWESRPPGDCNALRAHVEAFPEGAYRDDAADMISARRVTQEEIWEPSSKRLDLYVGQVSDPADTEAAARARASEAAADRAGQLCRNFALTATYRFTSAEADIRNWSCSDTSSGLICAAEGDAVCAVDVRGIIEEETCGGAS